MRYDDGMSDQPADSSVTSIPAAQQPVPSDQTSDAVSLEQIALQSLASQDPLNPPHAGKSGTKKETAGAAEPSPAMEVPGVQVVEHEPNVEIAPEVQGWIEKVEQEKLNIPENIVVADKTAGQPTGKYASEPVLVLPATQQQVNSGLHASVKQSIRWLATWCFRIMKKFKGIVVYRES